MYTDDYQRYLYYLMMRYELVSSFLTVCAPYCLFYVMINKSSRFFIWNVGKDYLRLVMNLTAN